MPARLPSILIITLTLFAMMAPASAGNSDEAPALYALSFTLEQGGKKLGQPRLLVKPGKPAQIRVESEDGRAGYRLEVIARPAKSAEDADAIDVSTRVFQKQDGQWRLASEPRMVVRPGKDASLSIGSATNPDETLDVELVAEPVSRQDAERLQREWKERYGKPDDS